jgi:putative ABC transporter-associated repeat protein
MRTPLTILLALSIAALPGTASAQPDDPELDQTLDPDQQIVSGQRVLDAGHVDMGPKYDGGQWRFLIHDDLARDDAGAASVWRYPAETVLHVVDEAQLPVPDDPAYEFLGAAPGDPVWVVPQTQHPDVVWLGWNTQDPEVMQTIDRGITLSLSGVQGPGVVAVYLQSGAFTQPQLLWDSRTAGAQPIWVDVNTHTHANWVFTEPGVYLLQLTAAADLVDGSTVSDTQLIRFAVGTATAPADAFAATWAGAAPAGQPATGGEAAAEDPGESGRGPLAPVLIGLAGLAIVALVIGFTVVVVRGNRARQRVLAARTGGGNGSGQ